MRAEPTSRSVAVSAGRRSVARSTVVVMSATAFSAVLGFGREIVTAHYYGTRAEMDAFLNASTVPLVLFGVFNTALVTALVPTFSEYVSSGRRDEVTRLGSTVINALFVAMLAVAALGWLAAPLFVPIVAHGFPPAEQGLVLSMVRWLMPGIVATTLAGAAAALLNANHRFLASASIWVAANVVTIGSIVALHRELGIFALVLGSVLGLFAQVLVQIPSLVRHGFYRFELDLRHPGLLKIWVLLVPAAIASGAEQINLAFDRYFASTLSAGSTAGLAYATKLSFLPILIVPGAIATVTYPLIASQFANANRDGFRNSISLALRLVSFIVLPCAAGLAVLAFPIVQTIFERGAFKPPATAFCASLVPAACVPLLAISYNAVLVPACYACRLVRATVGGSLATVVLNIALSATWLPVLGARGLLLANGTAGFVFMAFLIALLWRRSGGFVWKTLLSSLARIALAALAMAGALLWVRHLGYVPAATAAGRAWYLAGLLAAGAAVYLSAARLLRIEELELVVATLRKRFGRAQPPVA